MPSLTNRSGSELPSLQDNWRVSKQLSLTYGLRCEPFYPYNEVEHRLEQFNPAAFAAGTRSTIFPNAPAGLLFPGDPGVPEQGVNPVFTNVMPETLPRLNTAVSFSMCRSRAASGDSSPGRFAAARSSRSMSRQAITQRLQKQ